MPPRAAAPAISSARVSACGTPPTAVCAAAQSRPDLSRITQPTGGLLAVRPSARRDCAIAARIQRLSILISPEADPEADPETDWDVNTALFTEFLLDKGFKILGLAEIAIDRGIAHIGNLIEIVE